MLDTSNSIFDMFLPLCEQMPCEVMNWLRLGWKHTLVLAHTWEPTDPILAILAGDGWGDMGDGVPVLRLFHVFWYGDGAWAGGLDEEAADWKRRYGIEYKIQIQVIDQFVVCTNWPAYYIHNQLNLNF